MDNSPDEGDITGARPFLSNFKSLQGLYVTLSDASHEPYILRSPEAYSPTHQGPSDNTIDESFGSFPSWPNNFLQTTPYPCSRVSAVQGHDALLDEIDEDTNASGTWNPTMAPQYLYLSSPSTFYPDNTDLKPKHEEDNDQPTTHSDVELSPVPHPKRAREQPSRSKTWRTKPSPEGPDLSTSPESVAGQAKPSRRGHSRRHSKKSRRSSSSAHSLSDAPRAAHNNNEKQYRNRLNGQFEALLSNLPKDVISADVNNVSEDTANRKPSKGRVLDLAAMHIQALEQHCRELENENKQLDGGVKMFEKAWRRGGR